MRPRLAPIIVVLGLVVLAGCGETTAEVDSGARADGGELRDVGAPDHDGSIDAQVDAAVDDAGDADAGHVDASATQDAGAAGLDAGPGDGGPSDAGPPDAGRRVFDVRVLADPACSDLSFDPASIAVPAGTSFTVRWINATGCTEIDIDKDGTVPIVLGLEPGASYHDTIREWCGALFTGTFYFRAYYSSTFPYYLDVDCSG